MPEYASPEAGWIEAPDGHTAAAWLLHRYAHDNYGERAIVRRRDIYPLDYDADHWTASGYVGAPVPGDGRLDYVGIYVYSVDDLDMQQSYYYSPADIADLYL